MMAVDNIVTSLRRIVGKRHVLTGESATRSYRMGFRVGGGRALAVVRPGSLVEQWRVLQLCVTARCIVITQAANTGLTGGSTPAAGDYDRDVVIVSTLRIKGIFVIRGGTQVVCLPGATLDDLERVIEPLGREPHSVIGSSCIGASVIGGVCNNSGGSLVRRGPAYTELALYARVDDSGELRLINHLGLALPGTPEALLSVLERGDFDDSLTLEHGACASDGDYAQRVRAIDASTPARYNADPGRLFETSGCAGRLMVFAVRLDTFPKDRSVKVFYIGSNDTRALARLRRDMLGSFTHLPVAAEYIHRDSYALAQHFGKDTFIAIKRLGTRRIPQLFRIKSRLDAWAERCGVSRVLSSDRILQTLSACLPNHLPARMQAFHERYEHHLLLKFADEGIAEAEAYLNSALSSNARFDCTEEEASAAFLHRFAVAGAAIRYKTLQAGRVGDLVSFDFALARNDEHWFVPLPDAAKTLVHSAIYYGHFFCQVFHHDYVLRAGADAQLFKHLIEDWLDARGAEYPAEHNVGHLYRAKPALAKFYRHLDPRNQLNPGIGRTSKLEGWG